MVRTLATTSLAFILLAAFATLAGARADYPYPRLPPNFCEETAPLAFLGSKGFGGTWSYDGFIGGDSTTGPTFPSVCKQTATMQAHDGELLRDGVGR